MCRRSVYCTQTVLQYAALSEAIDTVLGLHQRSFTGTFGSKRPTRRVNEGTSGKFLSVDGTSPLWDAISAIMYHTSQTKRDEMSVEVGAISAVFHSLHGEFPPPRWLPVVSFHIVMLLIVGAPLLLFWHTCSHILDGL